MSIVTLCLSEPGWFTCFCYCDTIGHKSLHSCYEDDHSTGCTVCMDSALIASQLKKQGLSDTEIREKLIAKYSSY